MFLVPLVLMALTAFAMVRWRSELMGWLLALQIASFFFAIMMRWVTLSSSARNDFATFKIGEWWDHIRAGFSLFFWTVRHRPDRPFLGMVRDVLGDSANFLYKMVLAALLILTNRYVLWLITAVAVESFILRRAGMWPPGARPTTM